MTVRGRAPPRGVVDDQADQALPRQVRDRLVRGDGDGFAERRAVCAFGLRLRYVRRQTASEYQRDCRHDMSCFHVNLLVSSKNEDLVISAPTKVMIDMLASTHRSGKGVSPWRPLWVTSAAGSTLRMIFPFG